MVAFITENFDLPILDWIAKHVTSPILDRLMPAITVLGNGGILWLILAALLLLSKKHRATGITLAAALLMGLILCNLTMKPLFDRMRPFAYQLQHFGNTIPLLIPAPTDPSFPSGHTIASFEGATVLWLYKKKWGIPAAITALAIAFSRLYLYVHFPTDVLCSVFLGIGIGLLTHFLVSKYHSASQ